MASFASSIYNSLMSSSSEKMIILQSSDGAKFEIDEKVALESSTIKQMIKDDECDKDVILLPHINGKILSKVVEYCKKHVEKPKDHDEEQKLASFDEKLIEVDGETLGDLILAANYLNIEGLLNLTCKSFANMMKNMSNEEVREMLKIHNDYTPEETAELRRENAWAYESIDRDF